MKHFKDEHYAIVTDEKKARHKKTTEYMNRMTNTKLNSGPTGTGQGEIALFINLERSDWAPAIRNSVYSNMAVGQH